MESGARLADNHYSVPSNNAVIFPSTDNRRPALSSTETGAWLTLRPHFSRIILLFFSPLGTNFFRKDLKPDEGIPSVISPGIVRRKQRASRSETNF